MFSFFSFRFPLPDLKLNSTWNIRGPYHTLPVGKRCIEYKPISSLLLKSVALDKVEARSFWFTELESCWNLPISKNGIVTALSVTGGLKGDGTDDKINILTMNPLHLYIFSIESKNLQVVNIEGFVRSQSGNKPHFSLSNDRKGNILVHEETVS